MDLRKKNKENAKQERKPNKRYTKKSYQVEMRERKNKKVHNRRKKY